MRKWKTWENKGMETETKNKANKGNISIKQNRKVKTDRKAVMKMANCRYLNESRVDGA
jgi:hypothetical protein